MYVLPWGILKAQDIYSQIVILNFECLNYREEIFSNRLLAFAFNPVLYKKLNVKPIPGIFKKTQ